MTLPYVFIITLLSMVFIPEPAPMTTMSWIKMVVAMIFIIVAWGMYFGVINL
jgi:hypothetical protein